jgi:hypothetical protein
VHFHKLEKKLPGFANGNAQLLACNTRVQFQLSTDCLQADLRFRRCFRLSGWLAKPKGRLCSFGLAGLFDVYVMIVLRTGNTDMSGEIPNYPQNIRWLPKILAMRVAADKID